MGNTKRKKVIAWEDAEHKVICKACGNPGTDKPLIVKDFEKDDVIYCINCGKQIL